MAVIWNLNRYSYLITAALAMGGAWAAGARLGGAAPALGVAGVGIAMALAQRKLRGGASSVASWNDALGQVGRGTPGLLFLYSDT
jgi:hypothetical protein